MLVIAAGRVAAAVYRRVTALLGRWIGRGRARDEHDRGRLGCLALHQWVPWTASAGSRPGVRRPERHQRTEYKSRRPPARRARISGAVGELGTAGTAFTAGGASVEEIGAFTGTEAIEPIRIFAGTASAEDAEERAELAVRDLERGGFDRSNLLVVTTTGSGQVLPDSVSAFEYLTAGDSAIVAIQYSYLPSWLSYAGRPGAGARPVANSSTRYTNSGRRYRPMTGRGCWCSGRVSDRSAERRRSAGSTTWPAGSMGRCSRAAELQHLLPGIRRRPGRR